MFLMRMSPQSHFMFDGLVAVVAAAVIQMCVSEMTQKVLVARIVSHSTFI